MAAPCHFIYMRTFFLRNLKKRVFRSAACFTGFFSRAACWYPSCCPVATGIDLSRRGPNRWRPRDHHNFFATAITARKRVHLRSAHTRSFLSHVRVWESSWTTGVSPWIALRSSVFHSATMTGAASGEARYQSGRAIRPIRSFLSAIHTHFTCGRVSAISSVLPPQLSLFQAEKVYTLPHDCQFHHVARSLSSVAPPGNRLRTPEVHPSHNCQPPADSLTWRHGPHGRRKLAYSWCVLLNGRAPEMLFAVGTSRRSTNLFLSLGASVRIRREHGGYAPDFSHASVRTCWL